MVHGLLCRCIFRRSVLCPDHYNAWQECLEEASDENVGSSVGILLGSGLVLVDPAEDHVPKAEVSTAGGVGEYIRDYLIQYGRLQPSLIKQERTWSKLVEYVLSRGPRSDHHQDDGRDTGLGQDAVLIENIYHLSEQGHLALKSRT